jgi:predicted nucleic acid-binding protein
MTTTCSLARAAKAEIVSGDKDLLDLTEYQGIPILTTADALQHINTVKP